jgi:hypothetical protein
MAFKRVISRRRWVLLSMYSPPCTSWLTADGMRISYIRRVFYMHRSLRHCMISAIRLAFDFKFSI